MAAGGEPGGIPGGLTFSLSQFEVPTCPAPEFSVDDPVGDTFGFDPDSLSPPAHPDIVSVSGGSDAENLCLTTELAGPVDPPDAGTEEAIEAIVDFDTDSDPATGFFGDTNYYCPQPPGLGAEVQAYMQGGSGLLVPIFRGFFLDGGIPGGGIPEPPPGEDTFAIALFDENAFTLIVPLETLGGDDALKFAVVVESEYGPNDCAPNGGSVDPPTIRDRDLDGCVDAREQETGAGPASDPENFWDFFDTPNAANERDKMVTIADVARVVARFGSFGPADIDPLSDPPPAPEYHTAFDRAADGQGPDGRIDITDIGLIVAQFGTTCV